MAIGGTDVDFWRDLAAKVERDGLADAERYERLYSAAARMLTAQGPAAARAAWPGPRRQRWHDLELLLGAVPPAGPPGSAPDPSWQLASRLDGAGRPIRIDDAVRGWVGRLGAPVDATAGRPVVLPGLLYTVVTELLDELAGRLAPGRPVGAVGDGGAALSDLAVDLADQLREPVAAAQPRRNTAWTLPPLRPPQPVSAGSDPRPEYERLATAARLAAEALPPPGGLDLAVRHDASVAAADLLAGLRRGAGLGWRERYPDVRPDAHLVTRYRWNGSGGRPVGLAERAAELRAALHGLRPPRRYAATEPLPTFTPETGWIGLPVQAVAIAAELLDELAARMRPGRWIGTIRFVAFPLQAFLGERLRRAATGI